MMMMMMIMMMIMPVTVAERYKTCIVFADSEVGIVGSIPTQSMEV
jgi:hypothetical protein